MITETEELDYCLTYTREICSMQVCEGRNNNKLQN